MTYIKLKAIETLSFKRVILITSLIALLCFNSKFAFTQISNNQVSSFHNLQSKEIFHHIYDSININLKKDIYKNMTFVYAAQTAYISSILVNSNYIYNDKPEFEEYLNKVMQEILPEEHKSNKNIHVYLTKDGSFNALAFGSGCIFVNIGLFNEIADEATLASVLAHEFSHYLLDHNLYHFIAERKGEFDLGLLGESEELSNIYTIKDELQADSMAMQLMKKSKYNIKAMMNAFEMMGRLENNLLFRTFSFVNLKETDHPLAGQRYMALQSFYNRFRNDTLPYYIVSNESFKRFKKEAAPEILKCLMQQHKYYDCTEKAFRFHINDPDNITYIKYLLESIRKNCYLYPMNWESNFITERYMDTVKINGVLKKVRYTNHLFSKFNFNILPLSIQEASKIKTKFYWTGNVKFRTNSEAFDFFCRLSEALGDHEYLLSNALSYVNDSVNMKKYLQDYIKHDSIKYKEFAQLLLYNNDEIYKYKRKLLVFNQFEAKIRIGRVDVPIQSYGYEYNNDLKCILDSLTYNQKDISGLYLPSLRIQNIDEYEKLSEIETFAMLGRVGRFGNSDILILNPELWEIFKKYETNEIEFINCNYFEERGGKKTIDSYTSLINESFKEILSQNQSQKYINILISSTKINKKSSFCFSFMSDETKLNFSDFGYDSVIKELKQQMRLKNKFADEYEYKLFKN